MSDCSTGPFFWAGSDWLVLWATILQILKDVIANRQIIYSGLHWGRICVVGITDLSYL